MKSYLDIINKIIEFGEWSGNRTGVRARKISGAMFEHNMRDGFPLLTTKKMGIKTIATELEFFIKGLTDKKWLQERNCHIWDAWGNPQKAPYGNDAESKAKMAAENDLGKVYGFQWRRFNGTNGTEDPEADPWDHCARQGYDQLEVIVDRLHNNPSDRRMICSAWNPEQLDEMALPPCHLLWQVIVTGENFDTLNLNWYQRSVDTPLGLPFNIASYAILMILLAKEANMKLGRLCGMLGDVHIYENQFDIAKEQMEREPRPLPTLEIPNFTNIFDWSSEQIELKHYNPHPRLDYPIAV